MPTTQDPLASGRLRVMLYVSHASVLFACSVFAAVVVDDWHWLPALTGASVVAAMAAGNVLVLRIAIKTVRPTAEQLARGRERQRGRRPIHVAGYVTFAIAAALVSGSIPSYWPAIVVGAILFFTMIVLPLAFLPKLKRRVDNSAVGGMGGDSRTG